ncbi:MAG: hypothetical protein ACLSV2_02330 [Clostridium sp.]
MLSKIKSMSKKHKVIIGCMGMIILALIIFLILKLFWIIKTPTITLVPPPPLEVTNRDEFSVDVVLSDLPKKIYPAASITVGFDKNKLEFTGTKIGTMMTYGDTTIDGNSFNIPLWTCNIEKANEIGQINTMYLDMTAGKYAYSNDGFDKKSKNIVLRLSFKLKDSAVKGEKYNLTIHDAVIATVNGDTEKTSLATNQKTLRANSCKIVVQK